MGKAYASHYDVSFFAFGIAQIVVGYIGLQVMIGTWVAVVGLGFAFGLRIMLPMTIGSFFGAIEVLGWPWWGALLFAAPGLLFMIPGIIAEAIDGIRGR